MKGYVQEYVHVKMAALNIPRQNSYAADEMVCLLGVDFPGLR